VRRPARLAFVLYLVAGGVFVIDRVSKLVAEHRLSGRPPIVLIPHVLDLTFTTNTGGAFGLFGGQSWLFVVASVAVAGTIVVMSTRVTRMSTAVGLGMILGGALGNLTDRILHGPGVSGMVTDFIHLHNWPVFNAADSAIVLGAATIVVAGLWGEREESPPPAEPSPAG